MIHAYDERYLECARRNLGNMLDYGVNQLHIALEDFWHAFLQSPWADRFSRGDCSIVAGRSGFELGRMVAEQMGCSTEDGTSFMPAYMEKSREYWTGWALAYYQWNCGRSFAQIERLQPIREIILFYEPCHEMDIGHFAERMEIWYRRLVPETALKRMRHSRGLSQSELADLAGIPVRTLQQYEQRQKDISVCHAETIVRLGRALGCHPADLLE